jgi:F420-dependent oxidoreductase-like protein
MRKLGLYLGRLPGFDKSGLDKGELIECVLEAEASGYDSFWVPEAWDRDAFSLLAELAARTRRIGLGSGIINVFSRSPGLIAMSAATVDEISGGRFRLGLGASGARVIQGFHGMPYKNPLGRLRESIQIVRSLLAGERIDHDGECFSVSGFKLGFTPVRREIPIYLAALGPKGLRQLGELADGWLPVHWPGARLQDGIAEINAGKVAAKRDSSTIEVAPLVNVVPLAPGHTDVVKARNEARLPLAYYIGGMGKYYHAMLVRLGFGAEADRIRELWEAGRHKDAIRAVTDEMVDSIAICGDLGRCRARLSELYENGATLPIVPIPSNGTTADKCGAIRALIAEGD